MLTLDAQAVAGSLPYADLVDALEHAYRHDYEAPVRSQHRIPVPGRRDGTLLLMPAWQPGAGLGIKLATVFPDNAGDGLASVNASYLLLDATTGLPVALLDGTELTLRRTAASSALASCYLSRRSAERLLVVGTGKLVGHLAAAHCAVRPISRVSVWGRRPDAAKAAALRCGGPGIDVSVAADLEAAIADADIITCATMSTDPPIRGALLKPGQHVDLVGAFTPDMREADDEAMSRAELFVDTRAGTLAEAGEIVQALANGAITQDDLRAELPELIRGEHPGRTAEDAITLYKSVGTALADLAAARLALQRHNHR